MAAFLSLIGLLAAACALAVLTRKRVVAPMVSLVAAVVLVVGAGFALLKAGGAPGAPQELETARSRELAKVGKWLRSRVPGGKVVLIQEDPQGNRMLEEIREARLRGLQIGLGAGYQVEERLTSSAAAGEETAPLAEASVQLADCVAVVAYHGLPRVSDVPEGCAVVATHMVFDAAKDYRAMLRSGRLSGVVVPDVVGARRAGYKVVSEEDL